MSFYKERKKTPDVISHGFGSSLAFVADMPRRRTVGTAGVVFHVLNRGVRRLRLFDTPSDYDAFLTCVAEARVRIPIQLYAFCVMPNHFHLVVRPLEDGQLSEFMRLLTVTHSKRWHAFRGTAGTGSVYQGRYKAFPVQTDTHFLTVCRYVERNPLRAGLVDTAESWGWSSLAQRCRNCDALLPDEWPILQPADWRTLVNAPQHRTEEDDLRKSIQKSRPYGPAQWQSEMAGRLRLEPALRRRGRPTKTSGVFLRFS